MMLEKTLSSISISAYLFTFTDVEHTMKVILFFISAIAGISTCILNYKKFKDDFKKRK